VTKPYKVREAEPDDNRLAAADGDVSAVDFRIDKDDSPVGRWVVLVMVILLRDCGAGVDCGRRWSCDFSVMVWPG
jgi:hypothetical protein